MTQDRAALSALMSRLLASSEGHGYAGDLPGDCADRIMALMTSQGWTPPGAGFSDLLAHSVTATGGSVAAAQDQDEFMVPAIALTYHFGLVGDLAMHSQRFMAVDALRPLLDQLQAIADKLGV